jgi:hypothetical protein
MIAREEVHGGVCGGAWKVLEEHREQVVLIELHTFTADDGTQLFLIRRVSGREALYIA